MTLPLAPIASLRHAAAAYGAAALDAPAASGAAGASAPGGFADMVGQAAQSALNTVRRSESTTAAGVAGRADAQDVVQAVSDAEVTVQAVVAIRDRIVGAYNDVMRMSV
jgi:flagellar hook-basal body complex protein FliE